MPNEGFDPASFQAIPAATVNRPWDAVIEPTRGGALKAGHAIGKWKHTDGTEYQGYKLPDGRLIGCPTVLSQARIDANAAALAADNQNKADDAAFIADMDTLAQAIKDNTATAAQQRRFMLKLYRMLKGVLRDL